MMMLKLIKKILLILLHTRILPSDARRMRKVMLTDALITSFILRMMIILPFSFEELVITKSSGGFGTASGGMQSGI